MVPSWADQLLPQLLMEQFDTLPIQCRHIEHMHEGVIKWHLWELRLFFRYKLWYIELSGVNNFVLYSSYSLTHTVRGVSNKHCLLTFFHSFWVCLIFCPYFLTITSRIKFQYELRNLINLHQFMPNKPNHELVNTDGYEHMNNFAIFHWFILKLLSWYVSRAITML